MNGSLAKWSVRSSAGMAGAALAALVVLAAAPASANPMDLAPERLVQPNTLCTNPADPSCGNLSNGIHALPDNAAWAKLMSSYGMAIAPNPMHAARTTGYGGFDFSLFGTITTLDSGADWLHRGTEGPISGGKFPSNNQSPDGVLQMYGITGSKGIPYGFELQGSVGYIANTELVALGGGIRWALLEGFRTGVLGYFPDVSVGGYVNTLTGSPKVKLTVPSLDVQFSKPFTLANQVIIQPYLGWQLLWILADSSVVDATPGYDGYGACAPQLATGDQVAQTPGVDGYTGDQKCTSTGNGLDVNNNMVFQNLRFRRQRIMFGAAFRYELVHFVLHAAIDAVSPQSGGDDRIAGLPSQFTFGAMVGTSW